MVKLIIGGGFDVLHLNHKRFIDKAISIVKPTDIIVRLKSDKTLYTTKGNTRPLFNYEWRNNDIFTYLSSSYSLNSIKVEKQDNNFNYYVNNPEYIILFKEGYRIQGVENSIFIKEELGRHTSDILNLLNTAESMSICNKWKIGSVLVRDGNIICWGYNGLRLRYPQKDKCSKCHNGKDIFCSYLHAEEVVLEYAQKGDDLFISYSPCIYCARDILNKGIRRVVYFKQFHKPEGLNYLKEQGVLVRQAGLEN